MERIQVQNPKLNRDQIFMPADAADVRKLYLHPESEVEIHRLLHPLARQNAN